MRKRVLAGIMAAVLVMASKGNYLTVNASDLQGETAEVTDLTNEGETQDTDDPVESDVLRTEEDEDVITKAPVPDDNDDVHDAVAFSSSVTVDGVSVFVEADAGVIPEGTKLSVKKLDKSTAKDIDTAVSEVRDDDRNVAASFTFDISLIDANGNEIEPDVSAGAVRVTFESELIANENLKTDVYHVSDEIMGEAEKLPVVDVNDTTVTVETDGFSFYTVEFTYGELQYVLNGNEEVEFSDILKKLGLNGEITNVKGSNDDYFVTYKKDGKWFVAAKQAFSSSELLFVTIDGVEYEITVTDDSSLNDTWYKMYDYSLDDDNGTIILTQYRGNVENVVVPAKAVINEKEYHTILTESVFNVNSQLNIRNNAKMISFEEGVSAVGNVSGMFSNNNITEINLSGLNTKNVTKMRGIFAGASLETIDVSMLDTSNVENMNYMFGENKYLKSVNLSGLNTSNVKDMGYMFAFCDSLESVNLSGIDTSNVTYARSMFESCKSLKKINLSGIDTSKMQIIESMFAGCENLEIVNLSGFNTTNTDYMCQMFDHCTSLKEIDLSSFDTRNASAFGSMFAYCTNLKTIYVSKNWSVDGEDDSRDVALDGGGLMFDHCESLVGQNGTKYDGIHTGLDYAHIDVPGNPGYLSTKEGISPEENAKYNISGKISDQKGNALSGVEIKILSSDKQIAETTCREDGKYTVSDLPNGKYTIQATYQGVTAEKEIEVDGKDVTSGADIVITLADAGNTPAEDSKTYKISGRIIEPNNNGDPGVKISAGGKTVHSDKNGNFEITGLEKGTYEIIATHGNGTGSDTVTIVDGDIDNVLITLVKKGAKTSKVDEKAVGKGKVVSQVTADQDTPVGTFDSLNEDALDAILTDEEKEKVQNGAEAKVRLDVETLDEDEVNEADQALIEDCTSEIPGNASVGMWMDLRLFKSIDGAGESQVTDMKGNSMSITFVVPVTLRAPSGIKRTFYIIRVHDGKVEIIKSSTELEFKFASGLFSTYAVSYVDEKVDASDNDNNNSDNSSNSVSSNNAGKSANLTAGSSLGNSSSGSSSSGSSEESYVKGKGATKAAYTITGKTTARYDTCKAGNKRKSAKVPDTIKIGKKTYKVTTVSSYAFMGKDKLTSVTIGKNVKRIGESAFDGCVKLKNLAINTKKLKKNTVKNSLKGSSIKKLSVPEATVKVYKTVFKKDNCGSKEKLEIKEK